MSAPTGGLFGVVHVAQHNSGTGDADLTFGVGISLFHSAGRDDLVVNVGEGNADRAAAGILIVQTIFNVLGTLDVLPLTGVTFPFVSNGGSSMIAAWGLLAFIKGSDTRLNASFAVRQSKEGRPEDE